MTTTLIANDFHFPWADKRLLALWFNFIGVVSPDRIILNGDINDAACLSLKFDDVRTWRRYTKFSDELAPVQTFLSLVQDQCDVVDYVEGNHEDRLTRYIRAKASELDFVNLPELLNLEQRGIPWTPYRRTLKIGKLHVTHGHFIRKHAGESAKVHLDALGVNVLHGHSHRGGSYFRTNLTGVAGAWENFCMCRLDKPAHLRGQNWQQGWSVVYQEAGRFHVVQVPVIDYRFLFEGKLYTGGSASGPEEIRSLLRSLPR